MNRKRKLPRSFYLRDDVVSISRALLGKVLCTNIDGQRTSVIITETEVRCPSMFVHRTLPSSSRLILTTSSCR